MKFCSVLDTNSNLLNNRHYRGTLMAFLFFCYKNVTFCVLQTKSKKARFTAVEIFLRGIKHDK